PLILDPDAAAALALANSPELRIDAQSVAQAEAQLRQVLALDNFRLDLSANLVHRGPAPSLPEGFESFYIKTLHAETLTASKILWTWGQLESQRDLARVGVETAQTAAAVSRLALAKLARAALLKLAYDERLLDVDRETVASLMEHQRVTDKRYREGLIAFFEVAQAEAQVAHTQSLVADRLGGIERDRVALRRVLNLAQTTPVRVSVNNMPEQPAADLQACIEQALDARPEMRQAQSAVRLQEAAIRAAQTSLRPTVSVVAEVQDQTAGFATSALSYQVVVALQKPILDGGAQRAEVRAAKAVAETARLRLEQVAQAVAAEVADAYVQIEQLHERIAAAEMAERAAREQLRIARLRFEEDLGLGVEVIDAQAAVARAQTDRATAELDLNLAIVGLRAAMGMLDLQEAPEG
ncbi:MAG: TolC family protein, partial [Armatimonadetes bacterium]|nr:TolC family protein [Armatimonadota bacterium]